MPSSAFSVPQMLEHAAHYSRFFVLMLDSRPWLRDSLLATIGQPIDKTLLHTFLDGKITDENSLNEQLRHLRTWALCHILVRDLNGLADLAEVVESMTLLAEFCISTANEMHYTLLAEKYGLPLSITDIPQTLHIIGMGKLGGRELNVSSDIDLIFVYPEEGNTNGRKIISNFEFFERLGKRLIKTLSEVTAHGQVFRVDMRLRPNGDSGPLACSFDMLENYFITQGREWERYAWIKARVLTGERFEELEKLARAFVFRKYLDFGAIDAMRGLHLQIRQEVARKERQNNIKLGPGGIREIEFIAQVFQLIRAGRLLALQVRPTLKVLKLLESEGILETDTVNELTEAYVFLRTLEHRIQYLDDQQTHELPAAEQDRERLAHVMRLNTFQDLTRQLEHLRHNVSHHFNAVFADPTSETSSRNNIWQTPDDVENNTQHFAHLGFSDPEAAAHQLTQLHHSSRYRQLPQHIRARFDVLMPRIVELSAETRFPDQCLQRCLSLLETISRRGAYLALLQQYPQALKRVTELVSASPWAAQYLNRHPILLDELLDDRHLAEDTDWGKFGQYLHALLDEVEPDTERQMDILREQHHAQTFHLLMQDLTDRLTVETLADQLSALADTVLNVTLPFVWRKMTRRCSDTPQFAIIAYGKYGGKELAYSSDLDIIFIFDDPADTAMECYARFAQRINSWLSSQTAAGILFETDLRLRPNGESGLIVSSLDTFRKYQQEAAWLWEHQALTRARFVAGDARIGKAFEKLRSDILCQQRDLPHLKQEIQAMREKMRQAHPHRQAEFSLKHDSGGLIDVEFLVQYLVLGFSHQYPQLVANLGNIALLRIAGELQLIPSALAAETGSAYRALRRLQHRFRMADRPARIPMEEAGPLRAPAIRLWQHIFDNTGTDING